MRTTKNDIGIILRSNGGVIARRDHPELAEAMSWLVRSGELCPVFPGVYVATSVASDLPVRVRAALRWAPDAVLTGPAAARFSFWPDVPVGRIEMAVPRQSRFRPAGFELTRTRIPPELVEERHGLRFTTPSLTALDLCDAFGGNGIDHALRTRSASLEGMRRALELTPGRGGNKLRRQLLLDSRDEPWSAAERLAHQILRAAGITGWQSNVGLQGLTQWYFLDVAFKRQRVVLEIDGRLHEDEPDLFESDRQRQNFLVLHGWRVLRFTWAMLTQDPEGVVQQVLAALDPKTSLQLG